MSTLKIPNPIQDITITSTINSIEILKTILYWEANWAEIKKHSISHCLLRIYNDIKAKRVAVIASALNSNRQNIDIGNDFEALAKAVIKKYGSLLCTPISEVIWIQHYGRFSQPMSYDTLGTRDSFSKIDFPVIEEEIIGKGKEIPLSDEKIKELIGWTYLKPVDFVLLELFGTFLNKI